MGIRIWLAICGSGVLTRTIPIVVELRITRFALRQRPITAVVFAVVCGNAAVRCDGHCWVVEATSSASIQPQDLVR